MDLPARHRLQRLNRPLMRRQTSRPSSSPLARRPVNHLRRFDQRVVAITVNNQLGSAAVSLACHILPRVLAALVRSSVGTLSRSAEGTAKPAAMLGFRWWARQGLNL